MGGLHYERENRNTALFPGLKKTTYTFDTRCIESVFHLGANVENMVCLPLMMKRIIEIVPLYCR